MQARPAALLERRVVVPAEPVTHVETPDDALSVSLAERGRVDLPLVAELLGIDEADCLETLGDRVFVDPGSERVVIAAEYLLGQRPAQARGGDGRRRGVAGLRAQRRLRSWQCMPRDVTAGELEGVVGAPWVPVEVVTGFARHLAPTGRRGRADQRGALDVVERVEGGGSPDSRASGWAEGHAFGTGEPRRPRASSSAA